MKTLLLWTLAILIMLSASGCNLIEGIRQFDPDHKHPTPFSSAWWERRKPTDPNR